MAPISPDIVLLNWLLLLPFFAAACAALLPLLSRRPSFAREQEALARSPFYLGAFASLMALSLGVSLLPAAGLGGRVSADYWWTRDFHQLQFRADAYAAGILVAVHALGLLLHLRRLGLPDRGRAHRRAALLLCAQGCGAAAVLAADLVAIAFFLDLMLLCLWGLCALDARAPADRLLATAYAGSVAFLGGVALIWVASGETSQPDLALLLISREAGALRLMGVLVLLGLLPRLAAVPGHGWVPVLEADRAGGGLAPAVLLLPVGGSVLLRLLTSSFVLPAMPAVSGLALFLGVASLGWGALRAWFARALRHVPVWLAVAQSGYLLIALAGLAGPGGAPELTRAAALHLLWAPLALLVMWSAAAGLAARAGADALAGLSGLLRRAPLEALAFLAGGLSLAGVPPLPGYQVQRLLVSGLFASGRPALAALVLIGSLLVALAVADAFRQAFLRREPPPALTPAPRWASAQLLVGLCALLASGLLASPALRWSEAVSRAALTIAP